MHTPDVIISAAGNNQEGIRYMKRLSVILASLLITAISIQGFGGVPVLAAGGIAINSTNFPDKNFRDVISGSDYDSDGNGYLSSSEINDTLNIRCEGMDIGSIKGVEYFTALQGLWCKDNHIKYMDLSKNKDLRGVWCSGNDFTSLDFSANPELVWVYCFDCKLTSLNVSKNPHMAYLECSGNPLKTLDVSKNPELEHLICSACELKELDLSGNPKLSHLDALRNKLTSIDLSNNPELRRLDIWDNHDLGNVDISSLQGLQYYNCANNGVTSIDVSNNPELQKLICSYNGISKLDVSNNHRLAYLDCACNKISKLDLSNNPQLYFLQAFTNSFTKLDISNNSRLVKTYKDGYKQAEYEVCNGHSWSIDYGGWTELGVELLYFFCVDDVVKVSTGSGSANDVPDSYINTRDGLSSSDDLITRDMAIETLYALAGSPDVSGLETGFTDVKPGARCEDAIKWGVANRICFGYPNICSDTFGVGEYITREDLALMLHRYAGLMGYKTAFDYGRTDWFKDFYDIDYYSWGAFTWAIQWEILNPKGSKSDPNLYPHGRVTRSDLKTGIIQLLELNYEPVPSKIPIPSKPEIAAGWVKNSTGWWYRNADGSYPRSCWKEIDGEWYLFNASGYMLTGWQRVKNTWYYLGGNGAMRTGWQKVEDKWYLLDPNGAMLTGWQKENNKWYYLGANGAMRTGWQKIGNEWYYFYSGGAMATGWVKDGKVWYYMASSGAMQTGWKQIGGKWYYFYSSGAMAYSTTVDGYKLDASGAWISA